MAGVPCLLDIYHVNAEDPAERSTATNTLAKQVNAARDLGKAAFTHMQILLESNLLCVLAAPGTPQSVEPQLADAMGQIMDYRTMGVALSHIQASAGSK